jgi:hypothetical protein
MKLVIMEFTIVKFATSKIQLARSCCSYIETFTNKLPIQDITIRLAEDIIQVCFMCSVLQDFVNWCKDKQHEN